MRIEPGVPTPARVPPTNVAPGPARSAGVFAPSSSPLVIYEPVFTHATLTLAGEFDPASPVRKLAAIDALAIG